jgi:hypothetical protein
VPLPRSGFLGNGVFFDQTATVSWAAATLQQLQAQGQQLADAMAHLAEAIEDG